MQMLTSVLRGIVLGVAALGTCAAAFGGAPKEDVLLSASAFEPDLSGWVRQGNAEFTLDATVSREGRASARIAVAPGVEPGYQQLRRTYPMAVEPGDEFRASTWVRTSEVSDGSGAYLALEFVDGGDGRVGIAHSRVNPANGGKGWEQLQANGIAPVGTKKVRISLILHAHGSAWFSDPELARMARVDPWPDLDSKVRPVTIYTGDVVLRRFGGVGFHAFQHSFDISAEEMDQVIYKRWRELRPTFVRVNDEFRWDRDRRKQVAEHLRRMQQTGAEIYMTTWDPKDVHTAKDLADYARQVADYLEYWKKDCGIHNLHYYCMTNELSLGTWGALAQNLPQFEAYQRALHAEFARRKLGIGLLATDASPIEYWWTLGWAAQHMDDVTAIYGAHHYINDGTPEDERFYPWFLGKLRGAVDVAHAKGKSFILGEFGSKQDGRVINGNRMDACVWFDTPMESLVPIQMADAVIAAVNAGVYAMGYWTFMDLPDDFAKGYRNKWGLFRCSGDDRSTRDLYYGYALLTRYLRGPATVLRTGASDPRIRVAALRNARGAWSVAVVNRNKSAARLVLALRGKALSAVFRKYEYNPKHVTHHPFGDLPGPVSRVTMRAGKLTDTVGAGTLTVYTTDYDDQAPAAASGLAARVGAGEVVVTWKGSRSADLCYYRVYRADRRGGRLSVANQVGSTVALHMVDHRLEPRQEWYAVVPVDNSGNAGAAAWARQAR